MTSEQVKQLAAYCGFDLCGITSAEPIPEARRRFDEWLQEGFHGEMAYLAHDPDRRADPGQVLPGARSVIMLGLDYYLSNQSGTPAGHGRISRYARGRDYHKAMGSRIRRLLRKLQSHVAARNKPRFHWFVDFGPFFERSYAEAAGLGFIGKNGLLINKEFGSWVFLAEIITDLKLEPDRRDPISHGHCGSCRLCIEACPTEAIVSSRVIDARKCISYLTIERPSNIPEQLQTAMGDMVFGCDICQEVCPYNARETESRHVELHPSHGAGEFLNVQQVLQLESREEFLKLTAGTPLTRPKLWAFQRNARIVQKNMRG